MKFGLILLMGLILVGMAEADSGPITSRPGAGITMNFTTPGNITVYSGSITSTYPRCDYDAIIYNSESVTYANYANGTRISCGEDEITVIQSAINAVDSVFVSAGIYNYGSTPLLIDNSTTFRGNGIGSTVFVGTESAGYFIQHNSENVAPSDCILSDFEIDCNSTGSGIGWDGTDSTSSNIIVKNLYIHNAHNFGLYGGEFSNFSVTDCIFDACGTSSAHHCVYFRNATDVTATRCRCDHGYTCGIKLANVTRASVTDCTAHGNIRGFQCSNSASMVEFQGCHATGNTGNGFLLIEEDSFYPHSISIQGCTVEGYGMGDVGVGISTSDDVSIDDMFITGTGSFGVEFGDTHHNDWVISNTHIVECGDDTIDGIVVRKSNHFTIDAVFINNTATGMNSGIYCGNSYNGTIVNSHIVDCDNYGIRLIVCDNMTIALNHFGGMDVASQILECGAGSQYSLNSPV